MKWSGRISENIEFGYHPPKDLLLTMLIDDGVTTRGTSRINYRAPPQHPKPSLSVHRHGVPSPPTALIRNRDHIRQPPALVNAAAHPISRLPLQHYVTNRHSLLFFPVT